MKKSLEDYKEMVVKPQFDWIKIHRKGWMLIMIISAFILIHNHPSGDSTPSVTDISAAKTISEIGDLIDVSFKDMTILGDDNYTSLKQEGYF